MKSITAVLCALAVAHEAAAVPSGKIQTKNVNQISYIPGWSKKENSKLQDLVSQARDQAVDITDGYNGDEIAGVKLVRGSGVKAPYKVSHTDAMKNMSLFKDVDMVNKLRNGTLDKVEFSPEDVDLISRSNLQDVNVFYSEIPARNSNLPFLYTENKSDRPSTCCKVTQEQYNNHKSILSKTAGTPAAQKMSGLQSKDVLTDRLSGSAPTGLIPMIGDVTMVDSLPLLPTIDSFYHPVVPLLNLVGRGTPIAYRLIGHELLIYPDLMRSYQVLYRTENTDGTLPQGDVTVFWVPMNAIYPGSVVTALFHEDAINLDCSLSYEYATGRVDTHLLEFLNRGFAVNAPDFEGPGSALFATIRNMKSTIDSMRAVRFIAPLFFTSASEFMLYGYSAGALVAGYTLTHAEAEAPGEFGPGGISPIVAGAVGGFVIDLKETISRLNGGNFAAFNLLGSLGLASEYPTLLTKALEHMNGIGALLQYASAYLSCATIEVAAHAGFDITSILKDGMALFDDDYVSGVLRDNSVSGLPLDIPIYILQSTADEVADAAKVDDMVNTWCQAGRSVYYDRRADNQLHLAQEDQATTNVPDFFTRILGDRTLRYPCADWQTSVRIWPA